MGTIFVAYGDKPHREAVLKFAAKRAIAAGDDLFVYHIHESDDESEDQIRTEVDKILHQTAPEVGFEVVVERPGTQEGEYDKSPVSKQKQLLDMITATDRDYEYVVMGNVEQGVVEEFFLSSMSEAVLDTYELPVMLVPAATS